jgi:hypothetical protein
LPIADAGISGMAIALVNYVRELPVLRDEVVPRLARLGLRAATCSSAVWPIPRGTHLAQHSPNTL